MTESPPSPVSKLTDLAAFQAGSIVSRVLLKKKTGTVTLFAFGKGESLSEHTAPFDALIYVLEGMSEIEIAGQSHAVSAGETILLPANIPHAVRATDDFKMLLIMIREPAEKA